MDDRAPSRRTNPSYTAGPPKHEARGNPTFPPHNDLSLISTTGLNCNIVKSRPPTMTPARVDDTGSKKPRVVCLGTPKFVGDDYLADFKTEFDYSVLDAANRADTIAKLPETIAKDGPIDVFIIRMGTPPYEPFDAELLGALVPDCRIITSASAGYNEFDVEWMASENMWFCNTVDAVAEATADMALFLTLAVLRNTSNGERSARAGTWRAAPGLVPSRDPSGLTLGIVGMGAIGKVCFMNSGVIDTGCGC